MLNNNADILDGPNQQNSTDQVQFISQLKLPSSKISPSSTNIIPNTQSLTQEIGYFNDTAVYKIKNQQYKQALVFLKEAQNLLETGLRNCIKINNIHVLCLMQNIACVYQKTWHLEKSQTFMVSFLQNVKSQLKLQHSALEANQHASQLSPINSQGESLKLSIIQNFFAIKAYFQYFAICSQLAKHAIANECLHQVTKLLKQNCGKVMQLEIILCYSNASCKSNIHPTLQNLLNLKQTIDTRDETETILEISKLVNSVKTIQIGQQNQSQQITTTYNFDFLKITEINHSTIAEFYQNFNIKLFSVKNIKIKLVLYFSFCFLCMATENRLIAAQKYSQNRKFSLPYKTSKMLHLKAIQIYTRNLQYSSKYFEHLLDNYHKHYQQNFTNQKSHQYQQQPTINDIIDIKNVQHQQSYIIFQNNLHQQQLLQKQYPLPQQTYHRRSKNKLKKLYHQQNKKTKIIDYFDADIQGKKIKLQKKQPRKYTKNKDKNNTKNKYHHYHLQQQKQKQKQIQLQIEKLKLLTDPDKRKSSKSSKISVKQQNKNQKFHLNKNHKTKSDKLLNNKLNKHRIYTQQHQNKSKYQKINNYKKSTQTNSKQKDKNICIHHQIKLDDQPNYIRSISIENRKRHSQKLQTKASQQYLLGKLNKKNKNKQNSQKPFQSLKDIHIHSQNKTPKNNTDYFSVKAIKKIFPIQKDKLHQSNNKKIKRNSAKSSSAT